MGKLAGVPPVRSQIIDVFDAYRQQYGNFGLQFSLDEVTKLHSAILETELGSRN